MKTQNKNKKKFEALAQVLILIFGIVAISWGVGSEVKLVNGQDEKITGTMNAGDGLNLMDSPGINNDKITTLNNGKQLTILSLSTDSKDKIKRRKSLKVFKILLENGNRNSRS